MALLLSIGPALAEEPAVRPIEPEPAETIARGPVSDSSVPSAVPTVLGSKSPGRAVLLSLFIPGGGQVYTEQLWKAALIAPAELTLAYLAVRDHRTATAARAEGDTARYSTLRDRRNAFIYFTGAVIAYSMADAWVSARMYRFDRQMEFSAGPGRVGIRVGF